jgi:hypothetical protein
LGGSVSRGVYSLFYRRKRTLFAQRAVHRRTVFVRIAVAKTPRSWANVGKGLISVIFTELARFLLRRS